MSAPFLTGLLEPRNTSDWLDRRAGLERPDREAFWMDYVDRWLDQHHPRFNGQRKEAQ